MKPLNRVRWRSHLESRLADHSDDRGVALLTALMFMLFATGLSLVLLSVILSQAVPAYTAEKNTRTVYAAQAGLQSALALVRSADAAPDASNNVYGNSADLPCTANGNVAADGTGATYSVTVQYFTSDPTNTTAAWRAANMMPCSAGLSTVPKYAYVSSSGQDSAIPGSTDATVGNRALSAIYKFKTTNINIEGGMIYNSNSQFCMEAVTATAGSLIKFVPASQCLNTARQLWVYASDYELKLASTIAGGAAGLCITGPLAQGDSTQDALLQGCRSKTDPARWNQLWSWTGDYTWYGQKNPVANGPSTYCLSADANNGSSLNSKQLKVKKDSCSSTTGTFTPTLSVGAGAAGYGTHQIVNYQEFGRCADVTNNVDTSSYMISYPCKQDPTGTGNYLNWNHKWYYTEPDESIGQTISDFQEIYIYNNSGAKKCLTSPTAGGVDVTFINCASSGATATRQQWKRVNKTGDYSTSYLIVNSEGKCLYADSANLHTDNFSSKVRVTTCSGSLSMKWNAPPTHVDATFGGYREVAG